MFPSGFLSSRRQTKLFRQCLPPELFCITALEVNSSELWSFLCFCLVLIDDVLSKKEGEKHQLVTSPLSRSLFSCFSQGIWQHAVVYFSGLGDWNLTSVIYLLFFSIFFYFEALAMESPARYPVLCKKALKSALNLHRKQAVIDAEKFRLVLSHSFAMSLWLEILTGNKGYNLKKKVDFNLYPVDKSNILHYPI